MESTFYQNARSQALRVLAIGNSFSQDALAWLYPLAKEAGIKDVVLANLYIGGCALERHWQNAKENAPAYEYEKNTSGQWEIQKDATILDGLLDENWDMITMQQASGVSGLPSHLYAEHCLDNLIDYVERHRKNSGAKLVWQMTWAYDKDSSHPYFPNYSSDQHTMYQAIIQTVQKEIILRGKFEQIIPVGTTIQNLRTTHLEGCLTRDGHHLSLDVGRYAAALTWFSALTGLPAQGRPWVASGSELAQDELVLIQKAADFAVKNPYQITSVTDCRD